MSQRIGIIELGSNSGRLVIMEIATNGAYQLIYHQKETVRISQDADKNLELQPAAMNRTMTLLQSFAHLCKLHQADRILAVGTAAIRNTHNGADFIKKVYEETGIAIKIISGETEAKLGYLGAVNTLAVTDGVLFDLGGGSTELTLIKNRKAEKFISLPFGAVTLTERFKLQNKVNKAQLSTLNKFISQQLDNVPWLKNLNVPLIGIGGTARGIGKMEQKRNKYSLPRLHNYRTSASSFKSLWQDVKVMSSEQRRKIPGLSNDRADIILGGLAIVKNFFDRVRSRELIISSCGVREGLFLQYYRSARGEEELLADPLTESIHNTLLCHQSNTVHAYHVAKLTSQLFDDWQEQLSLHDEDKILLHVAAVLHDIGIRVQYYDHARHSAYLIQNAQLFGLSHGQQIMASLIASLHHSSSTKNLYNKIYNEFLDDDQWEITRKLALLLSLAESLDTSKLSAVTKVTTTFTNKYVAFSLETSQPILLELQSLKKHAKWLKKETGLELFITE